MKGNRVGRSARGAGTTGGASGRVALVTGGARKFGASVSRHLASQGYRVVINYRKSRVQAEALAEKIRGKGGDAMPCRADVTREADVRRMMDRVKRSFGRLDVLVNNVGDYLEKPLARFTTEEWEAIIRSNLTSVFLCSQEALPLMRKRKGGRIVMIGYAPAGKLAASPRCAVYHLAKTGALILAKSMAVEEAPHGITVNMISPGTIFNSVKKPSETASDYIPAGRFCRYADLLGMLDYLLSEEAAYVTGGHFVVSGGYAI
jgi:3-oxoacyl-[acyl-carrier protein] reductase